MAIGFKYQSFSLQKMLLHSLKVMNDDCIRKVFKLRCVRDTDYVKSSSFVIHTCISIARSIINTSIKCSITPMHFCTNDREEYIFLACYLYQRKFLLKHNFYDNGRQKQNEPIFKWYSVNCWAYKSQFNKIHRNGNVVLLIYLLNYMVISYNCIS